MTTTAGQMTAAQYLERTWDERWTELVDGAIIVNEPLPIHMVLAGWIYAQLLAWTDAAPGRGIAFLPIDVPIDERNVFAPDVCWYAEERRPTNLGEVVQRVPDLAVEVRSESTWRYDIGVKKARYESAGVAELWLVDTRAPSVLVFRRSAPQAPAFDVALELERRASLASPLLPGLTLDLTRLFRDVAA
jgi:Uma2 family endonuclease